MWRCNGQTRSLRSPQRMNACVSFRLLRQSSVAPEGRRQSGSRLLTSAKGDIGLPACRGGFVSFRFCGVVALVVVLLGLARPVQAFTFDSFGDGFWKIVNQANSKSLVVSATGANQAVAGTTDFEQQFELLYNLDTATFRVRNRDSWLCIGARNGATTNGTPVVEINYTADTSQRWNFQDVGGGYYRIVNVASGLALQTDNGVPGNVTLAASSSSSLQYWRFDYQTYYPKKGTGEFYTSWDRFREVSWCYNWALYDSSSTTPAQVAYAPMQWGSNNMSALPAASVAWRQSAKPQYLLGFNEPDRSDQANMSTAQAIALWPQLQACNVPLVSPACSWAFGGWLSSFYNSVSANGYRVDFTGVHWYSSPSASSLISHLQSVYNTWGRKVWLTEFTSWDFSGTATWTEEDNYRFLAEFLWQAEDLSWLVRYSVFPFNGTPSANPWDRNGHRGDVYAADNWTLTPFGELYAAWDADRTLRGTTPYLMQNLSTSHRLTSPTGSSAPSPSSIRVSDASAQWMLLPAPTSGYWYITSLRDLRRLRYNGTTLDLASVGTTGADVEWWFNGPDSSGYYFVSSPAHSSNLQMTRVNDADGAPTSITFSMLSWSTGPDTVRWRLVKPYAPVSGLVDTTPGVTVTASTNNLSATYLGAGTLTFNGSGCVGFSDSGTNNPTTFQMSGGTINIQSGVTLYNGGFSKGVWTNNLASMIVNGTLDLADGNPVIVDALTGGGTLTHTSYGTATGLTVGINNGSGTFAGTIQETSGHQVSLTKVGSGTQTLTGANTYTGGTTISGGTLQIGNGGTSGTFGYGDVNVTASATLVFNRTDPTASPLVVNNRIYNAALNGFSTININSGAVLLGGTANNDWASPVYVKNGATLILAKASSSSVHGTGEAIVESGGTLQLAGSGGDQIYDGLPVTVHSGGVFDLNSRSETVSGLNLAGPGIASGGALINSAAATTSTLTGGVTLTSDSSLGGSGNLTLASAIGGGFGLTKVGGGTLTLSGGNTFTGDTLVNAGTLQLNVGGPAIPGVMRLAAGATLRLNHTGTNMVQACFTNGVLLPPGVYAAGNLSGFITGTGRLKVEGIVTFSASIAASSDDVEESSSNVVNLTSTDLELVNDAAAGAGDQTIGLRFAGLPVPVGAYIVSATIQFTADEAQTNATSLTIRAQAADNAPTYVASNTNVSVRPRTAAAVTWSPLAWNTVGEAAAAQRTPNLAAVLQEVVSRPGWSSSNAVAFIITGAGHRTADSFDNAGGTPARLTVTYILPELPVSITNFVTSSADDAEESSAGGMNLISTDLELVNDADTGAGDQKIGVRFMGLNIPPGWAITNATIQFIADEAQSEATSLIIRAEAADNAPAFATNQNNISTRAATSASVSWQPPAWNTIGEASAAQQTPNLASVLQEVIDRPGWIEGTAVAFLITGTGHRTAESFDKSGGTPARLIVTFQRTTPPLPVIGIERAGNGAVSLNWPAAACFFTLYSATNLAPPVWTRATNEPVLSNGVWLVPLPAATNGSRFYRLQNP